MTTPTLDGVGVMVTRPAHQAEPLCERISAAGGNPYRFPVLEILEPSDSGPLMAIIDDLDRYDMAIFISPNAVNQAMNLILARRTLPEHLQLATVGRRSAAELRHFIGRDADVFPKQRFDSEALLELPEVQNVAGRRIVIFRGDGGRELLANTLRERGAEVTYAEAYRRGRPGADVGTLQRAWARGDIDIITMTSGEGLRNLFDMVGKLARQWLQRTPIVVASEQQRDLARELGFRQEPLLAEGAGDEAIIAALEAWNRQRMATEKTES